MLDREGNRIGSIDVIYLDDQTGQPEWALVNTGLFGTKATTDANIGAATSGPEISEEEHEVVLREEEPVVEKRVVPGAGPARQGHRDRRGTGGRAGPPGADRSPGRERNGRAARASPTSLDDRLQWARPESSVPGSVAVTAAGP